MARRLADVIVAPSPEMGETFVDVYGCDPNKVKVIEHGLDLTRFDPARADPHAVRVELGLDGKTVLGAISKHFWVKNLDALVHAFATIAAERSRRPSRRARYRRLFWAGALLSGGWISAARVTVLAPRSDVPDVLAACDLFVHPALAESFGFAIVEAMAMARPVVSRRSGSHAR